MNIGNKKAQLSKDLILEAFLKLMQEEAFQEITISQITQEAEVSRPTFYRNFNDKEDVLKMKTTKIIDEYIEKHNELTTLSVENIASLLFETVINNQNFFQLLVKNRLVFLFMAPLYKRLVETHRTRRAEIWKEYSNNDFNNFLSITFGACEYFIRQHINEENPDYKEWTREFTVAVNLLGKFMN